MLQNILYPNNYEIYADNISTNTGQIENLSVSLINGLPPPSAPPISAPVGSILTVVSPGVANFSSDIDVLGNIDLAGNSGIVGQYIKKTGTSSQNWSTIDDGDISPGLANQVMTTNSTGTQSKWSSDVSVDGNLIFNGIYGSPGQFVIKSSGSQLWHTLSINDIPAGSNNQVLTTFSGSPGWNLLTQSNFAPNTNNSVFYTNAGGIVQVDKLPVQNILHGTSNQVLETNSAGSFPTWTSQLKMDSIIFTGSVANFQSVFDRYYTDIVQLPLYAVSIGGSPSIYQNININGYFSVIGKRIELTIFPFTLASLFGGATAPCYLSMLIAPSYLRAANLQGSGGSRYRQSTCMCSISQNQTTQSEPAFANIYYDYYGSGVSYLELTKGNASNFDPNAYHGEPFVTAGLEFMELKAPFTISYIGQ